MRIWSILANIPHGIFTTRGGSRRSIPYLRSVAVIDADVYSNVISPSAGEDYLLGKCVPQVRIDFPLRLDDPPRFCSSSPSPSFFFFFFSFFIFRSHPSLLYARIIILLWTSIDKSGVRIGSDISAKFPSDPFSRLYITRLFLLKIKRRFIFLVSPPSFNLSRTRKQIREIA